MKPVPHVRPVTVIREQFTPSPQVQLALGKFVDGDAPSTFRIYSTAQRVVDQWEYRHSQHDHEVRAAQEYLSAMGREAIFLSGRTHLVERNDGSGRLLIEPRERDRLTQMAGALRAIHGLEETPASPHFLYVDFARDSLARSVMARKDAADYFQSRADHPALRRTFSVGSPEIVAQDVPRYLLRGGVRPGEDLN